MKLSTKGRYGVRAMIDLALNESQGQVSLKSIAERQSISENYLEQLFALLRKAGLVKSIRGSQGGYILSDKPENISVGAILRALEGTLAPVDCVSDPDAPACEKAEKCVTRLVWSKIHDGVNHVVDGISLRELMDEEVRLNGKNDFLYYI